VNLNGKKILNFTTEVKELSHDIQMLLRRFFSKLSHTNTKGELHMVNPYKKEVTHRTSVASCIVHLGPEAFNAVKENTLKKGDVLAVSKIAGIQASKQVPGLIPLCHQININSTNVDITMLPDTYSLKIRARVNVCDKTGCEMESMTAAAMSALAVYDMCKGVTKGIEITDLYLESKTGGKSGTWKRSK
jgi:cyclic pyranopterin phosphate synthase